MELLKLEQVSIAYDTEKEYAARDVSFSVCSGDYLCLIGSNGSGKSTLIKGIVGLVPITKGKIQHYLSKNEYAYLSQYNMIEQSFPATVMEVVLSGTQQQKKQFPFYTKADKMAAKEAMEMFGVSSFAERRIGNLSGGQQQRVLLARAFCRKPKLLILDEPCTGLDPVMTKEFYEILKYLNEKEQITIVMASHDMDQVEYYANRVIVLNQTVEFDGTVDQWKTNGIGGGHDHG